MYIIDIIIVKRGMKVQLISPNNVKLLFPLITRITQVH